MGTVWHAVDELLRQQVAIKEVLLPPELDDAHRMELRERTLREARAAARLRSHPSIVTVHDVVLDGGQPWIIMELVRGRSLDKIVRSEGPLPPQRVAAIGLAVLDALAAAHSMGILHRDVKPGNVLINDEGRVLLTDFGIATVAGDASLTQTGLLTGSPGYMAPERLRGEGDGASADLWSLGATLYTAVEGTPPFRRDNQAAVMAAVLMHEPQPMRLAGPLAPVLAAILEKDPARRCPPDQAAAHFHAIAAGGLHTGPTLPPRRAAERPATAGRTPVIIGAVLAVTLLAATGLVLWRTGTIPSFGATPATTSPPSTGRASAKASPPTKTRSTGLLGGNPEACTLLTNAQARSLLGGPVKQQFQTKDACLWNGPNAAFLEIQKTRFQTLAIARSAYDQTRSNMKDEPRRYPGTTLRAGPAVGDAAFSWTRRADPTSPNYQTTVLFRTANVMVSLYHSGRRPGFGTADHMAQIVNDALLAAK
jgi:serine/threonine protein kinase